MSDYQPGERVRVTIEGPVTQDALGSLYIDVGGDIQAEIPMDAPGVTVERAAPVEWPPRPGDLWRDSDGDLWFCRTWAIEDEWRVGLVCVRRVTGKSAILGGSLAGHQVLAKFGPLTLVHREDES